MIDLSITLPNWILIGLDIIVIILGILSIIIIFKFLRLISKRII